MTPVMNTLHSSQHATFSATPLTVVRCEVQFSLWAFSNLFSFRSAIKSFQVSIVLHGPARAAYEHVTDVQSSRGYWPRTHTVTPGSDSRGRWLNASGSPLQRQIYVVRRVFDPGLYYFLKQPFVSSIAEINYWNFVLTGAIDQEGGELSRSREESVFRGNAAPCKRRIWEHSRLSRIMVTANSIKDTKPV